MIIQENTFIIFKMVKSLFIKKEGALTMSCFMLKTFVHQKTE